MGYCTVVDIRDLGVPASISNSRIQAAIDLSSKLIDDVTGMWFEARSLTMKFDGESQSALWFPIPIIEVNEIRQNGEALDSAAYTVYDISTIHGHGHPKIEYAGMFSIGNLIIEVEGVFGWAESDGLIPPAYTPPPQIVKICKMLTVMEISRKIYDPASPSTGPEPLPGAATVLHETTDGHSYTLQAPQNRTGEWTGNPEIDLVLDYFRGRRPREMRKA